jgi:mono/diheme cytochrome c family protein
MTCAACHTANATVGGRPIRLEGAPAHLDFDGFVAGLAAALDDTMDDPERFARFAARLPDREPEALRAALAPWRDRMDAEAAFRKPATASGFGRVDALTQIISALAVRDQETPGNAVPVASPTSYPALWLTPQLDWVQWNPIASNPVARNGGQVLGVFGGVDLTGASGRPLSSSMRLDELAELEDWVATLDPPRWDEALMGPIDRALAAEGEALFAQHCAACHAMQPYRRTDPADNAFGRTFIEIGRVDFREVGTDPAYIQALIGRRIRTNPVTARLLGGAEEVPAAAYFAAVVGGAVQTAMAEAGLGEAERVALSGYRFSPGVDGGPPQPYRAPGFTDLKAGPLAAIWATGPYLHNGSVPTVYELLSPPEERRALFWTGDQELDLERLGYVSDEAPGLFRFDATIPGNRNIGHEYPAEGLTHAERMAVIEYLKTQ